MLETSTTGDSPVTVTVSSRIADAHLDVDRRREVGGQLEPFAHERIEPGERESHGVNAGTKIHDRELALLVGRHGADLFDEHGTHRLDRDPGRTPPEESFTVPAIAL